MLDLTLALDIAKVTLLPIALIQCLVTQIHARFASWEGEQEVIHTSEEEEEDEEEDEDEEGTRTRNA